jgi:hypothetical protein
MRWLEKRTAAEDPGAKGEEQPSEEHFVWLIGRA